MRLRHRAARAGVTVVLAALSVVAAASAGPPPWMSDESSYDVLTYSAWGRQNGLTGAECTGIGAARSRPGILGATHGSFRCQTQVGGMPSGVVVVKALGPQWLRIANITGGKLKRDRGIGPVPKGPPTLQNFDALSALQHGSWGKAHKISRALCYGVGSYQDRTGSLYYYAFSCATFDNHDRRGAQVLVTAAGKNAVRVVRTLAK
ncbi:MAG TPA: hypothetical protein VLJ76_02240 [Gaiellaceae bacterium]|nr:hypothetical protein [Gaiellaceae bacterium]